MPVTRPATVFIILALLTTPALARQDEPYYVIELIVFANRDDTAWQEETWPADPGLPELQGAVNLRAPATDTPPGAPLENDSTTPASFRLLPAEQWSLRTEQRRLAVSGRYRPLLHAAWVQAVGEEAVPVRVRGGAWVSRPAPPQPTIGNAMPPTLTPAPSVAPTGVVKMRALDGVVKIRRGRYLHVETDLLYRPAASGAGAAAEPTMKLPTAFRMQQKRRMRSLEKHYLDHPAFGVLIMATPYQAEQGATLPDD